jgi:hypothetical protein
LVHLSRGLAPELEQLRTQDINPDEDSAAYRALKRITTPKEEHSPESTDDGAVAADSRVKVKKKKKKKERNIEGREIKQVSRYACTVSYRIVSYSTLMHHAAAYIPHT